MKRTGVCAVPFPPSSQDLLIALLAAGVVTAARQGLLSTWPAFSTATNASNKQVQHCSKLMLGGIYAITTASRSILSFTWVPRNSKLAGNKLLFPGLGADFLDENRPHLAEQSACDF